MPWCRPLAAVLWWGFVVGLLTPWLAFGALTAPVSPGEAVRHDRAPMRAPAGVPMRVLTGAEVEMLRDPGGGLGIDDVAAPAAASRFRPIGQGLGFSYTDDAVWLRLHLRRAASDPADWRLELTSTYLNDVQFFEPQVGGGFRSRQAGDRHPFAERAVPYRRPAFDIHLPDTHPRVFYVRLRSDSTFTMQFVWWQARAFDASMHRDTLWIGGLGGIVLISMLFFLQAWFINRDRLLLSAAGVTLSFAVAAAANLGLLGQYLLPEHPVWADTLHPLTITVFFPLLIGLFSRALDVRTVRPGFDRLRWVPVALCVTATCLRWFGQYGAVGGRLMMMGMLLGLGWITAAAWLSWRARRRGPYAAVALTGLTALFSVAPLMALDVVPPTGGFEFFWVVSCIGFILMAQITTLEEVRRARAQRREAARSAVTARRQADQELAWRRQQTQYFVGVAHDLRTPLTALRVGLANLERRLAPASAEVADKLARLQASSRRVAEMIDRHLQVQRLEQPDIQIAPVPAAVADCLAQVRALLHDAWPQVPLKLHLRPGVPPRVAMEAEFVVRALTNLATNAAKAAPAGTAVEIEAEGDGQTGVRFIVRDHGPGLGETPLDTLVQMHWRRANAEVEPHDRLHRSLGIGLSVVQRVALLHRGSLSYEREPGGMTAFKLWLPGHAAFAGAGSGSA